VDRAVKPAVPEQAETQERQGHGPREEDAPDLWRDVGKGVPHAADDKVFKGAGGGDKGRLPLGGGKVARGEELKG